MPVLQTHCQYQWLHVTHSHFLWHTHTLCHTRTHSLSHTHTYTSSKTLPETLFATHFRDTLSHAHMGWLRLVGSLKLQVSSAKEPYERDDILQKRPTNIRSLLISATPYQCFRLAASTRGYISHTHTLSHTQTRLSHIPTLCLSLSHTHQLRDNLSHTHVPELQTHCQYQ